MNKRVIGISLVLVFLLSGITTFAQQKPAPGKLFFEKVFLHTDRDYYSTGDDIWFKAYLVDAQTNMPLGYTNNLHVDLISPEAKIINNEIVLLDNGLGKGDIHLVDSLPAGTYRLRAYTNWMRNFGDNFIFEKIIIVSNTIGDKTGVEGVAAKAANRLPSSNNTIKSKSVLRFYPEGGSMIDGVTSIVAFKAEDPNGKDIGVTAGVISSAGDTVAHVQSNEQGMGVFVFVPDATKTYTVKGFFDRNQPFSTTLPQVLAKGYAMHVSNTDPDNIHVTISTNAATLAENTDKQITLTARHTGQRVLSAPLTFNDLQVSAALPKKQFPAGVSTITIYDKVGTTLRPQAERLFFVPDSVSAQALTVKTVKPSYAPKGKVTLKIKAADAKNQPLKANLSVGVVDDKVAPMAEGNIVSYLMLQSEVRGKIEHPERYFDTTNTSRFKQIDLLLMTQGWRDFVWQRLADTSIRISYPAENGFAVSGLLREKFANKPIPNTNVTMSVKGSGLLGQSYLSKTDSAGRYHFIGIPVTGNKQVSLSAFDDKLKKTGWLHMDSINTTEPAANVIRRYTVDTVKQVAFLNADAIRSRGKVRLSDTLRLKEVNIRGRGFDQLYNQTTTHFGYPDLKYTITSKEYSYNSVRDWMIHEVPGAHVDGRTDSVYFIGTRFDVEKNRETPTNITPHFIVNSREDIDDLNNGIFLELNMDKVNKVTVRHVLGQTSEGTNSAGTNITTSGGDVYLVFLEVKDDAFAKVQLNTVSAHIDGYYEARNFYKPVYDASNMGKPDSRTTIHWEPGIVTDANGQASISFFNADPKSTVRVVVQGVTDKGVPLYSTMTYMVK